MRNDICERLKLAGIENYIFEAKIMEGHAKKYDLSLAELENLVSRRIRREPLQYILGEWEFFCDPYKLNKHCLIPRPETEFLTEYIIKNAGPGACVLDLGSGSGCVSISALKRRPDLRAALIEISGGALELSKENAELNGVYNRAEFYNLDIFGDFENIVKNIKAGMIVSNPPYLTAAEVAQVRSDKTELSHEPEAAFLGGADGLDFYRFIIAHYSTAFGDGTATVFECGINQGGAVSEMFCAIGFSCEITRDFCGVERVVAGYRSKGNKKPIICAKGV